jgi:CopG antitoxin of type II toxin-antitoxin system
MGKNKSSISEATSYLGIGEFWDENDLDKHWEKTENAEFTVDLQSEKIYFPIENGLSSKLFSAAKNRGVSAETLLNLWLQEKLQVESVK